MSYRMTLVIAGMLFAGTANIAEEAASHPDFQEEFAAVAKAKHLTEAAVHLKAAGRTDQADELLREVDTLLEPIQARLAGKQAERARLAEEIADLERKLGVVQEISVRVRLLSMDATEWALLEPVRSPQPRAIDEEWLRQLADREKRDAVKKLAETTIATRIGSAAEVKNGGEFPIPVPNAASDMTIQWREFGNQIRVLPISSGLDRMQVQLMVEHSIRDTNNTVKLNGTAVPGLICRKLVSEIEAKSGETILVGGLESDNEVVFLLATPEFTSPKAE